MRIVIASILCAALVSSAAAKPSPFEVKGALPPTVDDNVLYLGPVGAVLESDYFGLPQSLTGAGRIFPCRVKLHVIDRGPRFVQACD